MRKRLGGLEGSSLLRGFASAGLAALAMALGLWAWLKLTGAASPWLVAPGGVAFGLLIYGLGVTALQVPEIKMLTRMVSTRFRR